MAVPKSCTVLIVGAGPAGSYAACCLAREGIDTVVLEADKFPRYHIGESTLPSLRHLFKFIDVDDAFDSYGFFQKASCQMVQPFDLISLIPTQLIIKLTSIRVTDFIAAGGPNAYAWNFVRSESDDLLFRHAKVCGAHTFDETKVETIEFEQRGADDDDQDEAILDRGRRPVSATWSRKDGSSGTVAFDYLIDASGRNGILSTKYLKSRKFNRGLKNVASWAYWKSDNLYGEGTPMEGLPYFEALQDASGWCWFMPLHDGTRSVGVVQDQALAADKKRKLEKPSALEFYQQSLDLATRTKKLLSGATLASDVKSASDWSYTSSTYHIPYARICGDAGCFIDPLFSSGFHLAIVGGLSAAVTIAASIKGGFDEQTAGSWHSKKTWESYARFLLVVSAATKQIRYDEEPVMQDFDEEGLQRAFDILQPIIQGTVDADAPGRTTDADISMVLDFCFKAFSYVPQEKKEVLFEKLDKLNGSAARSAEDMEKHLTAEELHIIETLRSRRLVREDVFTLGSFTLDTIDGLAPKLVRGELGLVRANKAQLDSRHFFSPAFLDGKVEEIRGEQRIA
ncbi:hypothetical protein L249_3915 [Ophiocordyceps polyrhachis-furcata BCC 54312]|uniref:FAD-binding domain-containing protein n=1 Tax=Ophiocordyceps polyrhachis-furcata BCC 54312 TaxID=1330021 RepID=A0A367L5R5_9HYPO|nr:hypothetical protein L249_3915 [Ophiocordyceps polyrhachis-furcata BCC 54312]